ncbi:hypothetical protein ACWD7Y_32725 [Streptomyces drozdowiczii]
MSTTRRPLGTGPTTTTRSTTTPSAFAPRRLPVERAEPSSLLGDVEHQEVADRKGRRNLGPGVTPAPDELS